MARSFGLMRGWRPAAATFFAIVALCLTMVAPLTALAVPPTVNSPSASSRELSVEVVEQTPQVLTERQDFHLTVQLVNNSAHELRDITVQLHLQSWTPIARVKLEQWRDYPSDMSSLQLQTVKVDKLAAGGATRVQLPVTGEQLPLMDRGPRGLAVSAETGTTRAFATSFLIYWPPSDFPPLHYTVLLALVASADEIAHAPEKVTASARAEALAELGEQRAVTIAADPQFTAATHLPAAPRAQLPAGDPDLQLLTSTQAGRSQLASRNWQVDDRRHLLWWPMSATAETFANAPTGATVIADDRVLGHDRYYTPSALTEIDAHPTVVVDSVLSEHLAASGDFVMHRQALLAHLAATVRERPNDPRMIALAAPRNVDPAGTQLSEKLRALADQSWLRGEELPGLVQAQSQRTWPNAEQTFGDWQLDDAPVPATPLWDRIAEPVEHMRAIAATTDAPGEVRGPIDMLVTRLLTTALAERTDTRNDLLQEILQRSEQVTQAIRVETPSSVLLIADTTEIPLTIENALPADAQVQVTFVATDPRLQPGDEKATALPGNSRTTVRVPVNAVGSGNVWMSVHVFDRNGHLITTSPAFEVRVRADWESVGTGIVAAILVAVMIVGLARTILQHRSRPRGASRRPTIPPAHLRVKETNR